MILDVDYTPLPEGKRFHESPAPKKLGKGGKGSGKTLTMLRESQMLSFEFDVPNVGLLARRTFGEVQEVLIDELLKITDPAIIAEYRVADKKLIYANGSIVYFRALDESTKFKGLNLGWFGIDELDAATEEDWIQLAGQLRRPGVRHVAMGATNPVSMEHWIYKLFVQKQLPGYEVFTFRTKDNPYLPKDFYESLYLTMPESWVKRYLEGEWGSIAMGDRVYPQFSDKLHVYDNLFYNPALPIIRTWDFGLNGHAVVFFQLRPPLGADFLGEVFRQDMTSRQFGIEVARYSNAMFHNAVFEDFGDVAGNHRDATSGRSPIEEIGDEIHTSIITSQIPLKDSLDLVRVKLSQIAEGNTALRFHPRCRLTIDAMNGGYVFKKDRGGNVVNDVPQADAVFEHLMDAYRYGIWHKFAYARPERQEISLPPQDSWVEE